MSGGVAALILAPSDQRAPAPQTSAVSSQPAPVSQSAASSDASAAPRSIRNEEKEEFAAYAGSSACKECHQVAYDEWKTSNHGLAERPIASAMDERAFNPARTFQSGTQHTEVRAAGGKYEVVALRAAGRYEPLTVERVIGNDPLRQFLVSFPGGRYQALEASYDPKRDEWFNVYGEEDRRPGEWGHWTGHGMNWNGMCAGCHNTRLRKNYDEHTDAYTTTMAEMSVGCEACHGPMREHVAWRRSHHDAALVEPLARKLSVEQAFETCGTCHSRRIELTGDFAPGDSYYDHFSLTVVDETDTYYPNGLVRDEDYEYAAFLGSRMHATGVRCGDCHEPHNATTRLAGNLLCMKCHGGENPRGPAIDPMTHSFHGVDPLYTAAGGVDAGAIAKRSREAIDKSGGECINCHMPQTTYMQRHGRHDHGFTVPDPLLTKEHAIPNACNACHADKDAQWALGWTEKWYGAGMDRPSRRRAQAIALARRGQSSAREPLLEMLSGGDSPYWKAAAANLLGRWAAEPAVTAALTAATKDSSPLVRAHAARALGLLAENGAKAIEPDLVRLLDDPVRSVRFFAAWALRASLAAESDAARELGTVMDYQADQPTGQMQKGVYLLARGDAQAALPHYETAIEWDPKSAPIRHDLAVVLSTLGRNQDALRQLQAACDLEPQEAEYRYKLALAWNEVGNMEKTIDSLEAAVKLDPLHAKAWYNLALALNSVGRTPDALRALDRAEAASPGDPQVALARAAIMSGNGRR